MFIVTTGSILSVYSVETVWFPLWFQSPNFHSKSVYVKITCMKVNRGRYTIFDTVYVFLSFVGKGGL